MDNDSIDVPVAKGRIGSSPACFRRGQEATELSCWPEYDHLCLANGLAAQPPRVSAVGCSGFGGSSTFPTSLLEYSEVCYAKMTFVVYRVANRIQISQYRKTEVAVVFHRAPVLPAVKSPANRGE